MPSGTNGPGWNLSSRILLHINPLILRSCLTARASIHRIPYLADPASSRRRRNQTFSSPLPRQPLFRRGGHMAARHEVAFIDPGIADLEAGDAPQVEILSMSAAGAR